MRFILFSVIGITLLFFNSCHRVEASDSETRKKIVVVDTGLHPNQLMKSYMCKDGALGSSKFIFDRHETLHGSNIVGLIGERINVKKYCVVSINMGANTRINSYNKALNMITRMTNVVAVNLSIASGNSPEVYSRTEHFLIKKIVRSGINVFAAAGNDKLELSSNNCNVYPACLKYRLTSDGTIPNNFKVIGSSTKIFEKGKWRSYSNTGSLVDVFIDGTNKGINNLSGTSQATAIYVGNTYAN